MTIPETLVSAIATDLVGPATPDETLHLAPSRFYLAGFLVPRSAREPDRDTQGDDSPDLADVVRPADDDKPAERPVRRVRLPSSMGASVLVP